MNRDNIISMAKEAGVAEASCGFNCRWVAYSDDLERFFHAAYAAGAAVERYAILELLFEYEGRPDLTDDDLSLLKHLAELIAERGEK